MNGRPLVLCYHAVTATWDHPIAVAPETLERQLQSLLDRGFRPVAGPRLLTGGNRSLHVTFDDAFRSVLRAVPVLERLRLPATVFVCAALAETGAPLGVPELEAELAAAPGELATLRWDELRELSARGVTIGSHTLTHPHLTVLSDGELERELQESRLRIEDELGAPCTLLAYPYGEHGARVRAAARAAGYEAAFGLTPDGGATDDFAFPRVGIWRRDGALRVLLKTAAAPRALHDRSRVLLGR